MYQRTKYSPKRTFRTVNTHHNIQEPAYQNSRPVEYLDISRQNAVDSNQKSRVYQHNSPSPTSKIFTTKVTTTRNNDLHHSPTATHTIVSTSDPKFVGQDSYSPSPLSTLNKGVFESFQHQPEIPRENPYTNTQNSTLFTSSYVQGNTYQQSTPYQGRSPGRQQVTTNYKIRQTSPGNQRNPSPGSHLHKKIDALSEDNQILKTLTQKLQEGLVEAKRSNRVLQRQLDILQEQGNDPTNVYKLKKEIRDKILEDRNAELRAENEKHLLSITEANFRIQELEKG